MSQGPRRAYIGRVAVGENFPTRVSARGRRPWRSCGARPCRGRGQARPKPGGAPVLQPNPGATPAGVPRRGDVPADAARPFGYPYTSRSHRGRRCVCAVAAPATKSRDGPSLVWEWVAATRGSSCTVCAAWGGPSPRPGSAAGRAAARRRGGHRPRRRRTRSGRRPLVGRGGGRLDRRIRAESQMTGALIHQVSCARSRACSSHVREVGVIAVTPSGQGGLAFANRGVDSGGLWRLKSSNDAGARGWGRPGTPTSARRSSSPSRA